MAGKHITRNDLARGDIILTSMRTRTGNESSVATFYSPIVENNAINMATASPYSHAILVVGARAECAEFRNSMHWEKSLRDCLTDSGKDKPSIAHVFRHVRATPKLRERVVEEAKKLVAGFNGEGGMVGYAMKVWKGTNAPQNAKERAEMERMMVCSTFCAKAYAKAGYRLHPRLEADNMTPADIALVADMTTARDSLGARDFVYTWMTRIRNSAWWAGSRFSEPTLHLLGHIAPSEYA